MPFFVFEKQFWSGERKSMKNNQLGIVVRTSSGSFVVPVGTGSFLCVSALKVSVFLAAVFAAPVFSRASKTPDSCCADDCCAREG